MYGIRSTYVELHTQSVFDLSFFFLEYHLAGKNLFFLLNSRINLLMNCYESDPQLEKREG